MSLRLIVGVFVVCLSNYPTTLFSFVVGEILTDNAHYQKKDNYTAQEESDHPPRPLKGERSLWSNLLQQRNTPFIK